MTIAQFKTLLDRFADESFAYGRHVEGRLHAEADKRCANAMDLEAKLIAAFEAANSKPTHGSRVVTA